MDVSLILITYNKYPQILFTLFSLENQSYDHSKFEVILVDDHSTDMTISLKEYEAPFQFKYLRTGKNLDRAGAKNFGLREAEGKIVIFMDGEIMVNPDFIANHVRHYDEKEKIVVSGTSSHYLTFSVIHPEFTAGQLGLLHFLIRDKPIFLTRLSKLLGMSFHQALAFKKYKQIVPLLTREDIDTQQYKQLSFPVPSFPTVIEKFGNDLTRYHLAWTFFITRNVSVSKCLLDFLGPFNDNFKGWGYEDWELGYRLYKNGVKFIEDGDIFSYHQEHPFSTNDRVKEQMQNFFRLVNLHPQIEACALTLNFLGKRSLLDVDEIIKDFYLLHNQIPNKYILLKDAFLSLTQQIPLLLSAEKPVTRLWQQAGIEAGKKEELNRELEASRMAGEYTHFVNALDLLLTL